MFASTVTKMCLLKGFGGADGGGGEGGWSWEVVQWDGPGITGELEWAQLVRATLPPSVLFADRVLLHRGYSMSEPNT